MCNSFSFWNCLSHLWIFFFTQITPLPQINPFPTLQQKEILNTWTQNIHVSVKNFEFKLLNWHRWSVVITYPATDLSLFISSPGLKGWWDNFLVGTVDKHCSVWHDPEERPQLLLGAVHKIRWSVSVWNHKGDCNLSHHVCAELKKINH